MMCFRALSLYLSEQSLFNEHMHGEKTFVISAAAIFTAVLTVKPQHGLQKLNNLLCDIKPYVDFDDLHEKARRLLDFWRRMHSMTDSTISEYLEPVSSKFAQTKYYRVSTKEPPTMDLPHPNEMSSTHAISSCLHF